jgi:hypothetical protein
LLVSFLPKLVSFFPGAMTENDPIARFIFSLLVSLFPAKRGQKPINTGLPGGPLLPTLITHSLCVGVGKKDYQPAAHKTRRRALRANSFSNATRGEALRGAP